MKEVKWLVDKNEKTIQDYQQELDFTKVYALDRLEHVNSVLSAVDGISKDEWLQGYVSSNGFTEQQIKTKTDWLCEDEPFCQGLERIADYLIFPKFDNEQAEIEKVKAKKEIITKTKARRSKNREDLFGDTHDGNKLLESQDVQKTYKVTTKQEVTSEDLEKYPPLQEMQKSIDALGVMLGYGKDFSKEDREAIQNSIKEQHGNKYLFQLRKIYSELKSEQAYMKERLCGTIYFKHLGAGDTGTVLTLDENTGYFLEDDFEGVKVDKYDSKIEYQAGDYVSITENKIDFNKPEHVSAILSSYTSIKKACIDKPDSELWVILNTLEELIDATELTDVERRMIELKIEGLTFDVIAKILNKEGLAATKRRNLQTTYDMIPKKLVETHKQVHEDWLYTFKVKGLYKCCTSCGVNKLATTKYFSPQKRGKYGLKSICRECRK